MNSSVRTVIRTIAWALVFSLSAEQLAYAAPGASQLPNAANLFSGQKTAFNLPASLVSLDETYTAPESAETPKTLILIQDPHTNASGQLNIARAVDRLVLEQHVDRVFVEGGTGDVSLTKLRQFAPREFLKRVGLHFVRKGELQGVEYANLTADEKFALIGVEDPQLYQEALARYRTVVEGRQAADQSLAQISQTVMFLKEKMLNVDLRLADVFRRNYIEGGQSIVAYASGLIRMAENYGIDTARFFNIGSFLTSVEHENQVNFRKAEAEMAEQKKSGNPASGYHELQRYLEYADQAKRVDALEVFKELKQLQALVVDRLAKTEDEKELMAIGERTELIRQMIRLQAVPDEFEDLRLHPEHYNLVRITGFLNRKILDLGDHFERLLLVDRKHEPTLEGARRFYELTYRRDDRMVRNMLGEIRQSQNNHFIFVAGGFHAPNLKRLLKERGISYVSLIPGVTHETDQNRYERLILAQSARGGDASSIPQTAHTLNLVQVRQDPNRLASFLNASGIRELDSSFAVPLPPAEPSASDSPAGDEPIFYVFSYYDPAPAVPTIPKGALKFPPADQSRRAFAVRNTDGQTGLYALEDWVVGSTRGRIAGSRLSIANRANVFDPQMQQGKEMLSTLIQEAEGNLQIDQPYYHSMVFRQKDSDRSARYTIKFEFDEPSKQQILAGVRPIGAYYRAVVEIDEGDTQSILSMDPKLKSQNRIVSEWLVNFGGTNSHRVNRLAMHLRKLIKTVLTQAPLLNVTETDLRSAREVNGRQREVKEEDDVESSVRDRKAWQGNTTALGPIKSGPNEMMDEAAVNIVYDVPPIVEPKNLPMPGQGFFDRHRQEMFRQQVGEDLLQMIYEVARGGTDSFEIETHRIEQTGQNVVLSETVASQAWCADFKTKNLGLVFPEKPRKSIDGRFNGYSTQIKEIAKRLHNRIISPDPAPERLAYTGEVVPGDGGPSVDWVITPPAADRRQNSIRLSLRLRGRDGSPIADLESPSLILRFRTMPTQKELADWIESVLMPIVDRTTNVYRIKTFINNNGHGSTRVLGLKSDQDARLIWNVYAVHLFRMIQRYAEDSSKGRELGDGAITFNWPAWVTQYLDLQSFGAQQSNGIPQSAFLSQDGHNPLIPLLHVSLEKSLAAGGSIRDLLFSNDSDIGLQNNLDGFITFIQAHTQIGAGVPIGVAKVIWRKPTLGPLPRHSRLRHHLDPKYEQKTESDLTFPWKRPIRIDGKVQQMYRIRTLPSAPAPGETIADPNRIDLEIGIQNNPDRDWYWVGIRGLSLGQDGRDAHVLPGRLYELKDSVDRMIYEAIAFWEQTHDPLALRIRSQEDWTRFLEPVTETLREAFAEPAGSRLASGDPGRSNGLLRNAQALRDKVLRKQIDGPADVHVKTVTGEVALPDFVKRPAGADPTRHRIQLVFDTLAQQPDSWQITARYEGYDNASGYSKTIPFAHIPGLSEETVRDRLEEFFQTAFQNTPPSPDILRDSDHFVEWLGTTFLVKVVGILTAERQGDWLSEAVGIEQAPMNQSTASHRMVVANVDLSQPWYLRPSRPYKVLDAIGIFWLALSTYQFVVPHLSRWYAIALSFSLSPVLSIPLNAIGYLWIGSIVWRAVFVPAAFKLWNRTAKREQNPRLLRLFPVLVEAERQNEPNHSLHISRKPDPKSDAVVPFAYDVVVLMPKPGQDGNADDLGDTLMALPFLRIHHIGRQFPNRRQSRQILNPIIDAIRETAHQVNLNAQEPERIEAYVLELFKKIKKGLPSDIQIEFIGDAGETPNAANGSGAHASSDFPPFSLSQNTIDRFAAAVREVRDIRRGVKGSSANPNFSNKSFFSRIHSASWLNAVLGLRRDAQFTYHGDTFSPQLNRFDLFRIVKWAGVFWGLSFLVSFLLQLAFNIYQIPIVQPGTEFARKAGLETLEEPGTRGKVRDLWRVPVVTRVEARIIESVKNGQRVKQGDVLFRMSDPKIEETHARAKSDLEKAEVTYQAVLGGKSMWDRTTSSDVTEKNEDVFKTIEEQIGHKNKELEAAKQQLEKLKMAAGPLADNFGRDSRLTLGRSQSQYDLNQSMAVAATAQSRVSEAEARIWNIQAQISGLRQAFEEARSQNEIRRQGPIEAEKRFFASEVEIAKSRLRDVQIDLARLEIRSPISGTFVIHVSSSVPHGNFEQVNPNNEVMTRLGQVPKLNEVQGYVVSDARAVDFLVPAKFIESFAPGATVRVRIPHLGITVPGRVLDIARPEMPLADQELTAGGVDLRAKRNFGGEFPVPVLLETEGYPYIPLNVEAFGRFTNLQSRQNFDRIELLLPKKADSTDGARLVQGVRRTDTQSNSLFAGSMFSQVMRWTLTALLLITLGFSNNYLFRSWLEEVAKYYMSQNAVRTPVSWIDESSGQNAWDYSESVSLEPLRFKQNAARTETLRRYLKTGRHGAYAAAAMDRVFGTHLSDSLLKGLELSDADYRYLVGGLMADEAIGYSVLEIVDPNLKNDGSYEPFVGVWAKRRFERLAESQNPSQGWVELWEQFKNEHRLPDREEFNRGWENGKRVGDWLHAGEANVPPSQTASIESLLTERAPQKAKVEPAPEETAENNVANDAPAEPLKTDTPHPQAAPVVTSEDEPKAPEPTTEEPAPSDPRAVEALADMREVIDHGSNDLGLTQEHAKKVESMLRGGQIKLGDDVIVVRNTRGEIIGKMNQSLLNLGYGPGGLVTPNPTSSTPQIPEDMFKILLDDGSGHFVFIQGFDEDKKGEDREVTLIGGHHQAAEGDLESSAAAELQKEMGLARLSGDLTKIGMFKSDKWDEGNRKWYTVYRYTASQEEFQQIANMRKTWDNSLRNSESHRAALRQLKKDGDRGRGQIWKILFVYKTKLIPENSENASSWVKDGLEEQLYGNGDRAGGQAVKLLSLPEIQSAIRGEEAKPAAGDGARLATADQLYERNLIVADAGERKDIPMTHRDVSIVQMAYRLLMGAMKRTQPLGEKARRIGFTARKLNEILNLRAGEEIMANSRADDGLHSMTDQGALLRRVLNSMLSGLLAIQTLINLFWNRHVLPAIESYGIRRVRREDIRRGGPDAEWLERAFRDLIGSGTASKNQLRIIELPERSDFEAYKEALSELDHLNVKVLVHSTTRDGDDRYRVLDFPRSRRLISHAGSDGQLRYAYTEDLLMEKAASLLPREETLQGQMAFRLARVAGTPSNSDLLDPYYVSRLEVMTTGDKKQDQVIKRLQNMLVEYFHLPSIPGDIRKLIVSSQKDPLDLESITFGMLGLIRDWDGLTDEQKTRLLGRQRPRVRSAEWDGDLIKRIEENDVVAMLGFQAFPLTDIQDFFIHDPRTVSFGMTHYRSLDSPDDVDRIEEDPIFGRHIRAHNAGINVGLIIEADAKGDEEKNIPLIQEMNRRGIPVSMGVFSGERSYKFHGKLILIEYRAKDGEGEYVLRKDRDGQMRWMWIKRIVFISTGNFNLNTADVYTDVFLGTANPEAGRDAARIFRRAGVDFLQDDVIPEAGEYRSVFNSPDNLKDELLERIEIERANAAHALAAGRPGVHGRIVAKFNHLYDPDIIAALRRAAEEGVQIDLIIREINGLGPVPPPLNSEDQVKLIHPNIRIKSVIDTRLEHTRIFYFMNEGAESKVFIGSADLMERNMSNRFEIAALIKDPKIKNQLLTVLRAYLADQGASFLTNPWGISVPADPSQDYILEHIFNLNDWSALLDPPAQEEDRLVSAQELLADWAEAAFAIGVPVHELISVLQSDSDPPADWSAKYPEIKALQKHLTALPGIDAVPVVRKDLPASSMPKGEGVAAEGARLAAPVSKPIVEFRANPDEFGGHKARQVVARPVINHQPLDLFVAPEIGIQGLEQINQTFGARLAAMGYDWALHSDLTTPARSGAKAAYLLDAESFAKGLYDGRIPVGATVMTVDSKGRSEDQTFNVVPAYLYIGNVAIAERVDDYLMDHVRMVSDVLGIKIPIGDLPFFKSFQSGSKGKILSYRIPRLLRITEALEQGARLVEMIGTYA